MLLPVFCVILLVFCYMRYVASPIILKTTYAQIDTLATSYVSEAIEDSLLIGGYNYDDFIDIKYNNQGNISAILPNTININLFSRKIAEISQQYIDKVIDDGVDIAIGTFTGLNFLTGKGSKVNFKLVPVGSVLVSFTSNFSSAGINQTIHRLSIIVETTLTVVMPLESQIIKFKTECIVCENLIVGEVPNVYLNGKLF